MSRTSVAGHGVKLNSLMFFEGKQVSWGEGEWVLQLDSRELDLPGDLQFNA